MSGQHALVAPSGLHLTMECAASLLLQFMAAPVPDSEESMEGNAAHWHARQWASGEARLGVGETFKSQDRTWTVDLDMVSGAKLYAGEAVLHSEARFEDPIDIPDISQCWGTPDYYRWIPEINTLKVVDYKYGHRYVDAWENWQCIAYAIGIIRKLNIPTTAIVKIVIVQPRCYFDNGAGQEWSPTVQELFEYVQRIVNQVNIALAPNAPARTGKHCIDCKARHLCTTLQRAGMHIVEFTGVAEARELPNEALGQEARILQEAMDVLKARLEGLKTQVEILARSGKAVPFWSLENGRSLLKWNEDVKVAEVRSLGEVLGIRLTKAETLVTPTQAKDAGVDMVVLDAYATRLPSGKVLKPDSTIKTRKVFGANRV